MRLLFALLLLLGCRGEQTETRLVLAATTSLEDTGLLDSLSAMFAADHPDITLAPVAVGTGQAMQLARSGDADVIITHDSAAETRLVADGIARERQSLMYNDFVIVGPANDPSRAAGRDAAAALRAISAARALFVSRGDDSGTHRKEQQLWQHAGIEPAGEWYVEAGLGQGDALILGGQKRAYMLSDRATYLRFAPRIDLAVLTEGDLRLQNNYAVSVIAGEREAAAKTFADWLTSEAVQRRIGEFGRKEFGRSLFTPSAHGAALHDTIPTGER
jgi:tungstate transport system substrate-binding protein